MGDATNEMRKQDCEQERKPAKKLKDVKITLKSTTIAQLLSSIKGVIAMKNDALTKLLETHNILACGTTKSDKMYTLVEHMITSSMHSLTVTSNETLQRLEDTSKKVETKLVELTKQIQLVLPQSIEKLYGDMENTKQVLVKDWAEIVKSTPRPTEVKAIKETVKATILEAKRSEKRKSNVVVFGLPEEKDERNDLESFKQLCSNELSHNAQFIRSLRLGKRSDKPRPLLVMCNDESESRKILLKAKLLKQSTNVVANKVFIAADMTKEEREEQKKLREERRNRSKMHTDSAEQKNE